MRSEENSLNLKFNCSKFKNWVKLQFLEMRIYCEVNICTRNKRFLKWSSYKERKGDALALGADEGRS